MDDQLRRRSVGAPAARSLLLTILGEYVLPRGEAGVAGDARRRARVGRLHAAGRAAGAGPERARRLARDLAPRSSGAGVVERSARRTLLRTGAARIYSFGSPWQLGRPVARAGAARPRGAARGPPPAPDPPGLGRARLDGRRRVADAARRARGRAPRGRCCEAPAAEATSFVASLGALGRRRRTWRRPRGISTRCARRTRRSSRISRRSGPRRPRRSSGCRRCSCTPGGSSRSSTPTCPSELLPAGWPRRRAYELFAGRHARWQARGAVVLRGARGRPRRRGPPRLVGSPERRVASDRVGRPPA